MQNPVTMPSIIITGILAMIMSRLTLKKFSSASHRASPKRSADKQMAVMPDKNPDAKVRRGDLPIIGKKR